MRKSPPHSRQQLFRPASLRRATPIPPAERSSGRMTKPCSPGWNRSDSSVAEETATTASMQRERTDREHNEAGHRMKRALSEVRTLAAACILGGPSTSDKVH